MSDNRAHREGDGDREHRDVWTTPQVADFLDISRQAINKRVRNRTLLGYPGGGVTLFPAWQFDVVDDSPRPEISAYLARFDEEATPASIAEWSTTPIDDEGRTPVDLLLDPATRDQALALAGDYVPGRDDPPPTAVAAEDGERGRGVAAWSPSRADSTGAQQAILQAAAELFAEKGPAKVTLREIAAAADVSYGLIHRFYRTKENLLVAVMQLLVSYGGDRLTGEQDVYAAIENSFGADLDAGQFGRMLTWSIFEGTPPDKLLAGARSRGYRTQIEALWDHPVEPTVRAEYDSNVLAALLMLVGSVWNFYEPYLRELSDNPDRTSQELRDEVTDMLKLLTYVTRPRR